MSHLQILQSGLSSAEVVSDCLAVAKGRNLVLRSLAYLSSKEIVLNSILSNIHHVARNDQMDLQFWSLLAKYIDSSRYNFKIYLKLSNFAFGLQLGEIRASGHHYS